MERLKEGNGDILNSKFKKKHLSQVTVLSFLSRSTWQEKLTMERGLDKYVHGKQASRGWQPSPLPRGLPLFKGDRYHWWIPALIFCKGGGSGAQASCSGQSKPHLQHGLPSYWLMPGINLSGINSPLTLCGLIHSSEVQGWALPLRD